MRAVGAVVAATLRVDTISSSSSAQVLCRANFPNASGCLATQAGAQLQGPGTLTLAGCISFQRGVKVLEAGRLSNQRVHSSSLACRCVAGGSEDASNLPHERAGLRDGQNDGVDSVQDAEAQEQAGPSSVWDLPGRHNRMAAAAKIGDPLWDMVSSASKKLQNYLDNYKQPKEKADDEHMPEQETELETEWAQWQKVFAESEDRERLATVLKCQMEEAAEEQDFSKAARFKSALDAMTATDTIAEVMTDLKRAIAEERYDDAMLLRDTAGAGLVGWWVGLAEGSNDPYGRIINIYAAHGRLVAKGYSARQLATAAAGVPLFEIFVTKDDKGEYQQQAVYLQRDSNVATESSPGSSKAIDLNVLNIENMARDGDTKETVKDLSVDTSEDDKGKVGDAALLDEGLNKIMSFLKDRMPDVKLKVFKVIAPEGAEADIPKIVEQLMEQDEASSSKQEGLSEASTNNSISENKVSGSKFPLDGQIPVGGIGEEGKDTPIRLVVGGVLQNNIDFEAPKLPVRVPARLEHQGRNAFTFHIEDAESTSTEGASPKEVAPSWKVATIATQASADLMPDDVAKVLWNVEKLPVKVSKEMGEIIRLAVSQAQRRRGLFASTSFRRINVSESSTDPLCGLYIGAFGPYTSEVVQLQRKYGHWESEEGSTSGQNLEFFEYVEAVKLTGDLNVPAGQVTFRARTGRESRLLHRGAYPEELGVVTRYKGQGRLAEPGFRNPQWIDGELLLLDGKGGGHTNGAALGFVYSVPQRHFLVLFKRLTLKE